MLALVTGANRGIGWEIARQLADRGLAVLATGRDRDAIRRTGEELGVRAEGLDVADGDSVEALAHRLESEGEQLGCLVNNAGTTVRGFDAERAQRTMDVNFHGVVRVTGRFLPLLGKDARIVMVSSGMGELSCLGDALRERFDDPDLDREALDALAHAFVEDVRAGRHTERGWPTNAYRVSKVCMNAFTRILARELAFDPRRILVNAVCPGWVRTRMGGGSAPRDPAEGARTPVWLATLPPGGPAGGFFRDGQAIPW